MDDNKTNLEFLEPPKEFFKIIKDLLTDLLTTFPEYKEEMTGEEVKILEGDVSDNKLFLHCCEVFPGRFFDILYKKEEIFKSEEINTRFLPNIDFKYFFEQNISEATKDTLWKYLQLILFSISGTLTGSDSFGETAKLFEAINEDEFKTKLEETIHGMSGLFDTSNNDVDGKDISANIPNPEDINEHINGLLKGKLGSLAAEIAEETANELDIDIEDQDNANVNKVFEKLFKNPGRLLGMVKKVGSKLDEKIKSGEIKESELMEEASQLMGKMKNIPGVKNMEALLKKMGMGDPGGMGAMGKQKINLNAMQANLNRNIRGAKQRERMLAKLQQRKLQQAKLPKIREENMKKSDYTNSTFTGNSNEKMEKSMRPLDRNATTEIKKKKKKKKKNKK